jgi:hypothetical protein
MRGNSLTLRLGYSLMELTVSVGAASMLVVGIGSTIYVASQATENKHGASASVVTGSISLEQIAADLQYAINFTERSPNAVEFTVADRDGDASVDTVRYEWSGDAGAPVLRIFNGQTPQPVANDVHVFSLNYRVQTVTETTSSEGGSTESSEQSLASFTGWSGITPSESFRSLTSTSWATECFQPTWPEGAGELKITRVLLLLAKGSGAGDYSVGIYPAASGTGPLPSSAPIGTVQSMSGTGLTSSFDWVEIEFSDVTLTDPASFYNILVKGVGTGPQLRYYTSSSAPADATKFKYTANSGSTWSPSSSLENRYDAPFYVYGTYTTTDSSEVETSRHFVRSVGIALQASDAASARMDTSTEILNAPEVAAP